MLLKLLVGLITKWDALPPTLDKLGFKWEIFRYQKSKYLEILFW